MNPILYNEIQNYLLDKYASQLAEAHFREILLSKFLEKRASAKDKIQILKRIGNKLFGPSLFGLALATFPLSVYGTYGSIIGYGYDDPITHDKTGDKYLQNLASLKVSDPRVSFTLAMLLGSLQKWGIKRYVGPFKERTLEGAFLEKLFGVKL